MKAIYNLLVAMLALAAGAQAQSTISQVLASVEANNKTIQAEMRQQEAMTAYFRTGLSPADPELALDWLRGFPATAGNQVDFIAAQAFDFPTSYKHRKELAQIRTGQTAYETQSVRRAVLLEARLVCLRLVHLHKRQAELITRLGKAEKFLADYQKKLTIQDATILDVNKAQLQVLQLRTDLQLLEAERDAQMQALAGLNGGEAISFQDTVYPPTEIPDGFEALWVTMEAADPGLNRLKAQKQASETETRLAKSLLLPAFEAGYRYQGILGQRFHGAHLGVRVPIWENKKRMQYQNLQIQMDEARVQERWNSSRAAAKEEYDRYTALRASLDEYRAALAAVSNAVHLQTALDAGQITALEYFLELSLYYDSADRLLELEAAVQQAVARLMAHEL